MAKFRVTWRDRTVWTIDAADATEARLKARRKLAMSAPPGRFDAVMRGTTHSIKRVERIE